MDLYRGHRLGWALAVSLILSPAGFPGQCQTSSAPSKGLEIHLDPAETEIHWKLDSIMHSVHGTFKLKGGALVLNPSTGLAEGEILVDATTGESGKPARDRRMQKEILESDRYPSIFFHPTEIKGALKSGSETQDLTSQGIFNIHGADHPIEIPVKVQITGGTFTATAHFRVPYVAWGMKDPSTFLVRVGKQVDIDVVSKGTVQGLGQ